MMATMVNSSPGRPKGGSDAKQRIAMAAQELFMEHGYTGVSMRAIAQRADVQHSLVNYHFGSKDQLFGRVLGLAVTPHAVVSRLDLSGPPAQAAEKLVASAIAVWDVPAFHDPLVRTYEQDPVQAMALLRDYVQAQIFATLMEQLDGPRREERIARVATVMIGLFFGRVIGRVEPVYSLSPRDVVRLIAPLVATALQVPPRR